MSINKPMTMSIRNSFFLVAGLLTCLGTSNSWALRPDDFEVKIEKGTRAIEALVLESYYGKVPSANNSSKGIIVPTLRIGFRFQRGISVPPSTQTAVLPNQRGSVSEQSAMSNRIEGHWPLLQLPLKDKIVFKNKNGEVVQEVGFQIDIKKSTKRNGPNHAMVDVSAPCALKGAGLDNKEIKSQLIRAIFLGCDDIQNDVTLLVVPHGESNSITWNPTKSGDWRMGDQIIGLEPRGSSQGTTLIANNKDTVTTVFTGTARASSILVRSWGIEAYFMSGVTLSSREQHAAPRGYRAFDFTRTIPIALGARGKMNIFRKKIDAELLLETTVANFLLVGNGDGRIAFVPGIAWHLIEPKAGHGERWLPSMLFGIRQEIHDLFWTEASGASLFPVMGRGALQSKLLLRPELGIRLGHSMGGGTSWISYQATLTPGRYDELAPSLTLNHEIRYMHLGKSLNGWGLRLAHNRYRMKQGAWMVESDRITAGLLFSF